MPYFWIVILAEATEEEKARFARIHRGRQGLAEAEEGSSPLTVEKTLGTTRRAFAADPSLLFAKVDGASFEKYLAQRGNGGLLYIRRPSFWVLDVMKSEYIEYDGIRTAKHLIDFINTMTGHNMGPAEDAGEKRSLQILDPATLEAIVMHPGTMALVSFIKPHCAACETVVEVMERVSKKFSNHTSVVIGAVDTNWNVEVATKYQVHYYPSIRFFGPNNKSAVFAYDFEFTYDAMVLFMQMQIDVCASKSSVLI